jgi:UDP-2,4-diacetamido-2,4,6-trideoxy-beta-L-altropyranose hydrolase
VTVRIVFRVDASLKIGTGHVMRCLTLADRLQQHGATPSFICHEEPGNLIALIRSRGYEAHILSAATDDVEGSATHLAKVRPDWVIVDHYGLAKDWESAARQHAGRIFAIDDLADRNHDCDLLLDQNLYDGVEQSYAARVPGDCRQLIGPRYALLRPEFAQFRSRVTRSARPVSRLLVNFGGVDSTNETARILGVLSELVPASVPIDVVIGPSNPHGEQLKALVSDRLTSTLHVGTDRMAELMSQADAFIGAGGSTTWERFCLGLPSLVIAIAENQIPTSQHLGKCGAIDYIGRGSELTADTLRAAVSRFLSDHEGRSKMAELGMQLVDGHGAERVSNCLLEPAGA